MKHSFFVLALGVAACGASVPKGTGGGNANQTTSNATTTKDPFQISSTGSVGPGPTAGAGTIDVRLLGVNSPGGSIFVTPSAVDVEVDGQQVSAQIVDSQIDLGDTNQAWRVATFSLPAAAQTVAISLTLAPAGTVVGNGTTVPLDLSGPPISFPADPALLRTQDKVSLNIDLTTSIIADNGSDMFLPDFLVSY